MGHARLSPSAAERWMKCPGSVNLTAGMPNETSEAAQEGTNAHSVLEYCIQNWTNPIDFVGQDVSLGGVEFIVTQDMADAVQVAYDYVLNKFNAYAEAGAYCQVHAELKVMPTRLMRLDCEGTSDIIIETTEYIEVIDYKHGQGIIVEPDGNRQMQIYGIGALDTLGLDLQGRPLFTTIVQPRAPHFSGPIRSARYEEADVAVFTQEISLAAIATDDANAPLAAGEEQCRWCLAKATCKTLADAALSGAAAVFTDISVTTSTQIEANTLQDPRLLTPTQRSIILQNETLIKGWLKAVHALELEHQHRGDGLPDFKLTAGKTSRAWNLEPEELSTMLRSIKRVGGGKVTMEDVHVNDIKSPPQIEKLLKSSITKAAWKKIESAITVSDGTPQLTPASSSKPALPKPAEVFEDVSLPSFLA